MSSTEPPTLAKVFQLVAGHHSDDSIQIEYEHFQHIKLGSLDRFLALLTDFSLASNNHTVSLQWCPKEWEAEKMAQARLTNTKLKTIWRIRVFNKYRANLLST